MLTCSQTRFDGPFLLRCVPAITQAPSDHVAHSQNIHQPKQQRTLHQRSRALPHSCRSLRLSWFPGRVHLTHGQFELADMVMVSHLTAPLLWHLWCHGSPVAVAFTMINIEQLVVLQYGCHSSALTDTAFANSELVAQTATGHRQLLLWSKVRNLLGL